MLRRSPWLLLLLSTACLAPLRAAEEVTGLYLDDNLAVYEGFLGPALAEDAAALTDHPGAVAAPDPQAAAFQRGDWLRAYREANLAAESADPVVAARGKARGAWILARLGLPHQAISRVNEALSEPAARGEVMLARAWILWQVGAFEIADKQFESALVAVQPPPAWAVAEWKKLRAARAKDAAACAAMAEPDDSGSPEFLDYADKARAVGAFNLAASRYTQALSMLQQQQQAQPGTPRTNLERALNGLRESVLGAIGGRLPGADYAAVRNVMLQTARAVAAEGGSRAMWESYFKLLAESLADRGRLDYTPLNVVADVATAERQAGVGPEWRERFRPLLNDPRLRYASQLQLAISRTEGDPAFGHDPQVEDPKQLDALVERLARDEEMLKGLRTTLAAGTAPLPEEVAFAQIAAVTRLRQAMARRDGVAARAQLALVRSDAGHVIDRGAYELTLTENERRDFFAAVEALDKFSLEDMPAAALARAGEEAKRAQTRLWERLKEDFFHPERLSVADREEVARILEIRLLAAAHAGQVLLAEAELASLEEWCKAMPGYPRLETAQVTVLEMKPRAEAFTPEEKAIADAIDAGQPPETGVKTLVEVIRKQPQQLTSRLLLLRLHWALLQDHEAGKALAELRQKVKVNEALPVMLDQLEAQNDTIKLTTAQIDRLRAAPPAQRVAVAQAAEAEITRLIKRYQDRFNDGQPIPRQMEIGMAIFPYLHLVAAAGCTQAAQGRLRPALDLLQHVTLTATQQMLRDYLATVPFRRDLPNEAAVKAWRLLLADRDLDSAALTDIHATLRPHYGRSLTADAALVLLRIRNREFDKARAAAEKLREGYGLNRAYAAQLDQLDYLISHKTEIVFLFESSAAARREREVAQDEKGRYVNANFDTIRDTYQADGSSVETRQVEALEKRIDDLAATANAIDDRNQQKLDAAEKSRADAQTRAFANLRSLTL